MAPQLGMGTFRISHTTPHWPGPAPLITDSYATANAEKEVWALRKGSYHKPSNTFPDTHVTMYFEYMGGYEPDLCDYIRNTLRLDPDDFEIWEHDKREVSCPRPPPPPPARRRK